MARHTPSLPPGHGIRVLGLDLEKEEELFNCEAITQPDVGLFGAYAWCVVCYRCLLAWEQIDSTVDRRPLMKTRHRMAGVAVAGDGRGCLQITLST